MKSGTRAISTARDSISSIPGLHLWLDGTDATTMTISGGLISQWRDKSAVGNHLSQATGSLQPTMGTLSGMPAVFFDGTGRYLLSSPLAGRTGDTPFSAFIVWNKTHAVNTGCRPFGWGGADQGGFVSLFGSAAGSSLSSWSFGGTAAYNLGLQPNAEDYHLTHTTYLDCIVKRAGILRSTTACYRSGEYKVMHAGQAALSLTLRVLGASLGYTAGIGYPQLPAAATSLNGHIGEIIVFSTAVSEADRKVIENYLSKKWAVNLQNFRTGTAPANAPVSSPLDVSGCSLWLDTSDSSTLFSDAAGTTPATTTVRMWSDKSTAAQHVKTTGTGPTYKTNLQGGKPGLFFDTVGTSLISTASRSTPVPCTILAVVKNLATTSSVGGVVCYGDVVNGGGTGGAGIYASAATEYIADGVGAASSNSSDTSSLISALPKIITARYAGADTTVGSKMFSNNVLEELFAGTGVATHASVCVEVGGRTGGSQPTRLFRGNIHEVITYDRAITEPERCSVERYLSEKWGIAITAPTCGHPDAQGWVNRVYENRGSVSQNTANNVNDLCYSIDSAGIRDRFMRLNLFCGNNLAACLVPLYRGGSLSGAQYGGRIDTNVGFVEADYVESGPTTGLKGNAANKRLDTGVVQSDFPVGSKHMAAYETERDPNAYRCSIGSRRNAAPVNYFYLETVSPGTTYAFTVGNSFNNGADNPAGYSSAGAFWVGVQTSSTTKRVYKNGIATSASDSTVVASTRVNSFSQYVFALNESNAAVDWSNVRLGAYSLGLSMSAAQIASYNTIMQAFQTSLGRNV